MDGDFKFMVVSGSWRTDFLANGTVFCFYCVLVVLVHAFGAVD